MGIEIALIAGLAAASIAGSGVQAYNAKKASTASRKSADHQNRLQEEQLASLDKQQKEIASGEEKTRVRDQARNRQKQASASATGRRSTILTSPLGVSGNEGTGQQKTLLGA